MTFRTDKEEERGGGEGGGEEEGVAKEEEEEEEEEVFLPRVGSENFICLMRPALKKKAAAQGRTDALVSPNKK